MNAKILQQTIALRDAVAAIEKPTAAELNLRGKLISATQSGEAENKAAEEAAKSKAEPQPAAK